MAVHRKKTATAAASLKRTHSFLFGCTLTEAKREVAFPGGGDDLEEQLSLRTVSLGLGAPDELHVLEAEGETHWGKIKRVPVATVRPRLQSTVLVGELDLVPPVTFCLVSGSGPLHVSGEHLVASGRCPAKRRAKATRKRARRLKKSRAAQALRGGREVCTAKKKLPGGAAAQTSGAAQPL